MKYYKAVECNEHMLFSKEIASMYSTNENKLTWSKVINIIDLFMKENNIVYEQLYYKTRYGLCRVYPFYIYDSAIKWYRNKYIRRK